ncbi:MAG: hypothetical protein NTW28_25065 [Candidatus Solibacter sp.]|nr:hypothetical protein [Candidatus Solibacter sp.]
MCWAKLARFPVYLPKPEHPASDAVAAKQTDEAIPADPDLS